MFKTVPIVEILIIGSFYFLENSPMRPHKTALPARNNGGPHISAEPPPVKNII
jgi:Zn-dependent protease